MSGSGKGLGMLTLGVVISAIASTGCAERLADCVEVYANTGAVRRQGHTRATCAEHCDQVTGWIDCYWDGEGSLLSVRSPELRRARDPQ